MSEPDPHASHRGGALRLLVVIPYLDEAPTVGRVVAGARRDIPGIGRLDIVVVDDGSSDGTGDRAQEAGAEVVNHTRRSGSARRFGRLLASPSPGTPMSWSTSMATASSIQAISRFW